MAGIWDFGKFNWREHEKDSKYRNTKTRSEKRNLFENPGPYLWSKLVQLVAELTPFPLW